MSLTPVATISGIACVQLAGKWETDRPGGADRASRAEHPRTPLRGCAQSRGVGIRGRPPPAIGARRSAASTTTRTTRNRVDLSERHTQVWPKENAHLRCDKAPLPSVQSLARPLGTGASTEAAAALDTHAGQCHLSKPRATRARGAIRSIRNFIRVPECVSHQGCC